MSKSTRIVRPPVVVGSAVTRRGPFPLVGTVKGIKDGWVLIKWEEAAEGVRGYAIYHHVNELEVQ